MLSIAANDLKTRGIAAIETGLLSNLEATISVRGQARYVVMPVNQYHHLRECELELALAQTRSDLAAGKYKIQSALEHFQDLEQALR